MKKLSLIIAFLASFLIHAQTDTLIVVKRDTIKTANDTLIVKRYISTVKIDTVVTKKPDTTVAKVVEVPKSKWSRKNKIGLNISQVAFVNWNAGGNNSISALVNGNFGRKYTGKKILWNNEMALKYGINAQEGQELRKTDDAILLSSTFGYRNNKESNWYFSAKGTFNTQLSNGYKYPDTSNPISRFLAPGYLFVGIGSEYVAENKDFTMYISPVTQKSTFVLDQDLADAGSFGVQPAVYDENGIRTAAGDNVYTELGFLVNNSFQTEIYKNMNLNNRLSLYSDYLNSFGNVDIDWELNLDLTVNQYVKANIGTHLKYDNDVKFEEVMNEDGSTESFGPKLQFKQLLGVGLQYAF